MRSDDPSGSEHHARGTADVLRQLFDALEDPGAINPAHAHHVRDSLSSLLEIADPRPRMPTSVFPRSAVVETPDPPPVPPAAL